MIIEGDKDIMGLMKIGRVVAQTMYHIAEAMKPGMTTRELDEIGAKFLASHGARSAPILTYNYPGHTCISVNDEAAHGIPGDRVIQPGDLVNIDVSAELDGYFADTGRSFAVPPVTPDKQRLLDTTEKALYAAIKAVRAGKPLNVIGQAVEAVAHPAGYRIIRELGGHGIGRKLHETPNNIPHYFERRARTQLKEGMVLTIEPFLTTGAEHTKTMPDGWTLKTTDGSLAAQFEHTMIITKGEPLLLTAL